MTSILYEWFMDWKVDATIDEARRNQKSTLCLTNCGLKGFSCDHMMKVSNSFVVRLLLQENEILALTEDFGLSGVKLQFLSLAYNQLTRLPITFGELDMLTRLNISHNDFSVEGFPLVISKLKSLRVLWANSIGIHELPTDVEQMADLRLLGLRNNSIRAFPTSILKLRKLQWLTMAGNCIEELPRDMDQLEALIHLNLNFNKISSLPPETWARMQKLRYLFLKSNKLIVDDRMIRDLQVLPNLGKVDLNGNEISGTIFDGFVTPETRTSAELETLWENPSLRPSKTDFGLKESSGTVPECLLAPQNLNEGTNVVSSSSSTNPHPIEQTAISPVFSEALAESQPVLNRSNYAVSLSSREEMGGIHAGSSRNAAMNSTLDSGNLADCDESETNTDDEDETATKPKASCQKIKIKNHLSGKQNINLVGPSESIIENEKRKVNKQETASAPIVPLLSTTSNMRLGERLSQGRTSCRIRTEVPVLDLLPRPIYISHSFQICNDVENIEIQNSSSAQANDGHPGNESEMFQDAVTVVLEGIESQQDFEFGVEDISQEVLPENEDVVPIYVDNNEGAGIPGLDPLFMQDQEAQDGMWDHSENSNNLDNMEFPSDDSDFEDLPLEVNEEKMLLYAVMLA